MDVFQERVQTPAYWIVLRGYDPDDVDGYRVVSIHETKEGAISAANKSAREEDDPGARAYLAHVAHVEAYAQLKDVTFVILGGKN